MDQPDVADVVAAAAGDVAAFERLVRLTQGGVWRYVVHIVGDSALAEDIAQEVFLRVHRKLHTLQEPDRFIPWLLSVARNAAYDAGRSKQRRPVELVGDRELPTTGQTQDPHITLEVYEALEALDSDLREAIILVGVIGLSYEEAASAIGIPEGTVKSRVFRCRKLLALSLGVGGEDDS
jgi:RNA polymerase sigma-70 factor (ECF subfamily)